MQDFPANSQKAKRGPVEPEPKKIERVTSATAERRPRGLGKKFKETFVGGSAKMAIEYMITDVVVPAIQDTLIDAFQGGIERLIKGEGSRRRSGTPSGYGNVGHVAYNRMSSAPTRATTSRMLSRQSRTRQDFDELVIPSRQEAEEVLERMYDILSRYEVVTVHDLYELTGVAGTHIDKKWGWEDLRGARADRLRNGSYLLNLPDPEPLD
jgi:hypothetical protein